MTMIRELICPGFRRPESVLEQPCSTTTNVLALAIALVCATGCYRASGIPPVPATIPAAADSSAVALARSLAPVLYVQRDEYFPLERVVAVVHPQCPVVAYVLDWKWDVNGQWVPWSKSSDEEEVWVGFDSLSHLPTDLWTYWHGSILHTDWRGRGQAAISVQWGKHGSLPHGVIESDLPNTRSLNVMYALDYVLLPDMWLGKLVHGGPWGFFHGYARYRDFSRVIQTADRLDAVVQTATPTDPLRAVLGARFSNKRPWPWSAGDAAACPAPSPAALIQYLPQHP
jgi:RimJ/RimL family protein N-acetyltransferase